ncbi:tripartite motif-containing protein 54 [Dasypus novemcinctus]|uniref:tripartite motif-containing protein 54 n=1 Tax=Dasypus novemcinctus TaxID=9361 RepID=UPI0003CC02B2|nr:tripartite motif-containing protein 54 [Dasypus novemcinctus]
MEALGKVLSCPVCMELFTPPVLVLSCSHNFCQQCLELILVCHNSSHIDGQFCCPVCRKVIYLRGRGTNGLQRNILAENILEKFKEELEILHTKAQNQLTQMCEKHGEIMNLMCLSDGEPICGMCKLFGDHESHQVAKISDAYSERKVSFAQDIQLVLQKSESTAQAMEETAQLTRELLASAADACTMIDTIGNLLLRCVRCRMATLKKKLENEHSSKLEKLQLVAREFEAPRQLYQQMKTLLEQHVNAVQFLHEEKKLKLKMEKLLEGTELPQVPTKDIISVRYYFRELIKGITISDFVLPKELCEAPFPEAWRAGCPDQDDLSEETLQIFCKSALGSFPKPKEEATLPGNASYAAYTSSSRVSSAQRLEVVSKESTV